MKFDSGDRKPIRWDGTTTTDPTGATVQLRIDATTYPMTLGTIAQSGQTWTIAATSADLFAGPDVDPGAATMLTKGRHTATVVLTIGELVLEAPDATLDVA